MNNICVTMQLCTKDTYLATSSVASYWIATTASYIQYACHKCSFLCKGQLYRQLRLRKGTGVMMTMLASLLGPIPNSSTLIPRFSCPH